MSEEGFYGRPLPEGFSSLEFELCEICQRKTPIWLETMFEKNTPIVRFTCNNCHEEVINKRQSNDPEFYTRQFSEDEISESGRPPWLDSFIKEQSESGSITTIDDVEKEVPTGKDEGFSKAPDSFTSVVEQEDEGESINQDKALASWGPKFIQEALFGSNPEAWLEAQQAYKAENVDITIKTLTSFLDHDVSAVKLSAIQCLFGAYKRDNEIKNKIIKALNKYKLDEDDNVRDFAVQTIESIK